MEKMKCKACAMKDMMLLKGKNTIMLHSQKAQLIWKWDMWSFLWMLMDLFGIKKFTTMIWWFLFLNFPLFHSVVCCDSVIQVWCSIVLHFNVFCLYLLWVWLACISLLFFILSANICFFTPFFAVIFINCVFSLGVPNSESFFACGRQMLG